MVGQKVIHSMPVRADRYTGNRVRSRQESLQKCMKKPDAKGNGANNSRGKGGCSYKCRRSLDQLDSKYRKCMKFGLGSMRKRVPNSLSANELEPCFDWARKQRRESAIRKWFLLLCCEITACFAMPEIAQVTALQIEHSRRRILGVRVR